jgi:hypothetical protein
MLIHIFLHVTCSLDLDKKMKKYHENKSKMDKELQHWHEDLLQYRQLQEKRAEQLAKQQAVERARRAQEERLAKERLQKENMKKYVSGYLWEEKQYRDSIV